MKAIICTKYGPPEVLQLREVSKPVPKKNEVLIKIYATSVHRGDSRIRSFDIPGPRWQLLLAKLVLGIRGPRKAILGMELSGKVEEVGKEVQRFKKGDKVYASTVYAGFGTYAEYKCISEDGVVALMPSNMSYEEAAVIPAGGITTLGVIKQGNIQSGQKVLIYGASGSVGSFAVQLAKNHYKAEVIGVCSTTNLELVKSLGADRVIDYTKEDFTQSDEVYDVIFDAVDKFSGDFTKVLKKTGIYLNVDKSSDKIKKKDHPSLLKELSELIEAGKLKAVIDRTYTWGQIVEAHRYVDTGRKKGNIAVTIV